MITWDKTALRGNRKRLSMRSSALFFFFLHCLCCTSSQFECGVSSEWTRATKLRIASRAFKTQEKKKRKSSRLCGPFFPSCLVVITIVITFDSCFLSLSLPLSLFDICSLENSCFSLTTFFSTIPDTERPTRSALQSPQTTHSLSLIRLSRFLFRCYCFTYPFLNFYPTICLPNFFLNAFFFVPALLATLSESCSPLRQICSFSFFLFQVCPSCGSIVVFSVACSPAFHVFFF